MIPRTYPSTLNLATGQRQLVALFLSDVTGLQRWSDYIPVNFGKGTTLIEGSYDNNGYIAVEEITSGIGLIPFGDYVPVFFDPAATDTWQVSSNGFIPYGVSGVTSVPSLDLVFTRSDVLDSRITFTRASTATRTNASGLIESVAIDGARFDYDPVTLAPKGLLIEEQRVNLCLQSENFSTTWTNVNSIEQTNAIVAPDGTQTADLLQADSITTASARDLRQNVTGTVTAAHTLSVYAKAKNGTFISLSFRNQAAAANSCSAEFNLATGTISIAAANAGNATGATASITSVGNGWYRCSVSGIADTSGTVFTLLFNGRTTSNSSSVAADTELCYLWGAQLEAGAFATSYIPTEASQVTRAADSAVMTGTNFSSWYNADVGALFSEASTYDISNSRVAFAITDGSATNRIHTGHGSGAKIFIAAGGTSQLSQTFASVPFFNNTASKVALTYELNNGTGAVNGTIGVLDTVLTVPTVTQARVGGLTAALTPLNGHVRHVSYYPRRLANAELQGLTA